MKCPVFTYRYPSISISLFFSFLFSLFIVSCDRTAQHTGDRQENPAKPETGSAKAPRTVRLLTYWYPTAQFAGYIVGVEKGIFKKYGIDLQILKYDQRAKVEEVMGRKSADFMVSWLVNSIKMRDNNLKIINIAQFSSRSSLMLITKKSSGINTLQKMQGKRAGIWLGYEMQPTALFRKFGLKVQIVPIGSTNNLFLMDGVDIINANEFDEYHTILNSGYDENELNTFHFCDYGLNFLEDGLYCLEDFADANPGLCRDFVKATIESWQYAFDHPEESVKIVIGAAKKLNYPVNFSHQAWMLKKYEELYIPKGAPTINSTMSQKDYMTVAAIMQEAGLIKTVIPYPSFFKPVLTR